MRHCVGYIYLSNDDTRRGVVINTPSPRAGYLLSRDTIWLQMILGRLSERYIRVLLAAARIFLF